MNRDILEFNGLLNKKMDIARKIDKVKRQIEAVA